MVLLTQIDFDFHHENKVFYVFFFFFTCPQMTKTLYTVDKNKASFLGIYRNVS